MIIHLIYLFLCSFALYYFFKKIIKNGLIWIVKGFLQAGILVLFIGGFFKIFFTLPPYLYIKIIFIIIYTWCTIGINVNFMIPLMGLIDQKLIEK